MTTYKTPPAAEPPPRRGMTSRCGPASPRSSAASSRSALFDILNPDQWAEYLGALIVAVITAGAVYAKERLDDAKRDP